MLSHFRNLAGNQLTGDVGALGKLHKLTYLYVGVRVKAKARVGSRLQSSRVTRSLIVAPEYNSRIRTYPSYPTFALMPTLSLPLLPCPSFLGEFNLIIAVVVFVVVVFAVVVCVCVCVCVLYSLWRTRARVCGVGGWGGLKTYTFSRSITQSLSDKRPLDVCGCARARVRK